MINIDMFLDILEKNFRILTHNIGRPIEMAFIPSIMENPFGVDAMFKWEDRSMVYQLDETKLKMDSNKVVEDLTIMLTDKFAPRPSRIGQAAMPKNQVPTNNRTRLPNWTNKEFIQTDYFDA